LWQKAVAAACVGFLVHAVLFSFSRGGMLGMIVVVAVSFFLIPKRPVHYLALIAGVLLTLSAAGPQVVARFNSSFKGTEERDGSAQSRLDLWGICIQVAGEHPVTGLGPHHFHVHAHEFGMEVGKEAHTTWLSLAAEIGIPGVSFLLLFFVAALAQLWPITRTSVPVPDPFLRDVARMTIAAIVGYMFTAQFVTLYGVEGPYYVVLLGVGALKIMSPPDVLAAREHAGRTAEAGAL
jgi:O-antigen ligase